MPYPYKTCGGYFGPVSCIPALLTPEGTYLVRRRYGTEDLHPDPWPEECRDCGVHLGGAHHLGCCVEMCAVCGDQAMFDDEHADLTHYLGEPPVWDLG
jgi:hypothetical protein